MPFTLPPKDFEEKRIGDIKVKIPDLKQIQSNKAPKKEIKKEEETKEINVFDLPLNIILRNIANAILLILRDIIDKKNYSSIKNFLKIFMIENRLIYIGIFMICLSFLIGIFFS